MRFVMMMTHTCQGGAGGIHAQGPFQRPCSLRTGSQAQACRWTDIRAHAAYNALPLVVLVMCVTTCLKLLHSLSHSLFTTHSLCVKTTRDIVQCIAT